MKTKTFIIILASLWLASCVNRTPPETVSCAGSIPIAQEGQATGVAVQASKPVVHRAKKRVYRSKAKTTTRKKTRRVVRKNTVRPALNNQAVKSANEKFMDESLGIVPPVDPPRLQ